jgi:hypothetical protein
MYNPSTLSDLQARGVLVKSPNGSLGTPFILPELIFVKMQVWANIWCQNITKFIYEKVRANAMVAVGTVQPCQHSSAKTYRDNVNTHSAIRPSELTFEARHGTPAAVPEILFVAVVAGVEDGDREAHRTASARAGEPRRRNTRHQQLLPIPNALTRIGEDSTVNSLAKGTKLTEIMRGKLISYSHWREASWDK